MRNVSMLRFVSGLALCCSAAGIVVAAPTVNRLTPPSNLFSAGTADPVVARFLTGQRFDLAATATPDAGQTITAIEFLVDDVAVPGTAALTAATGGSPPAGRVQGVLRAYSNNTPGVHTLTVRVTQSDGMITERDGNFEIAGVEERGARAKNVIFLIGDGMGIAHRTAARIMAKGVAQGKTRGLLAMDTMPYTGMAITHSLNSIVTDSSPGSSCYSSGNKGNNNQHGVFPDDTTANFDNPRVELIGEYLHRVYGTSLGIVTTSDVFDATPAAWASHTQSRGAGTGIVDQYLDESANSGLSVILGGGRKWYLPAGTPGSARSASTDYALPAELATGWGVPAGAVDTTRDLITDHITAGWTYAANATELAAIPATTEKLVGLFALSNMNVALDKIDGRRGTSDVVDLFGFPDQPMLDEMTASALQVLSRDTDGFVLMVEAASIDKQAHNMDTERWILDTIEFDRAVQVCLDFLDANPDTLVVVTADHECAGVNIIGGSRVTDAALQARIAQRTERFIRNGVVGTYEAAGFPRYTTATDGYPMNTNIDFRMLIGYAANADRYEDWRTNALPLRDGQQPFAGQPPLSGLPGGPLSQDTAGKYLVTGQIADPVAAHTASDIPFSAAGRGAQQFIGVKDNTDLFFLAMQAAIGGW